MKRPAPAIRAPARPPARAAGRPGREIRSGRIAPGTRPPAGHGLERDAGTGRGAAREAPARLRAGGLARARRGAGAFAPEDGKAIRLDPRALGRASGPGRPLGPPAAPETGAAGLAAGDGHVPAFAARVAGRIRDAIRPARRALPVEVATGEAIAGHEAVLAASCLGGEEAARQATRAGAEPPDRPKGDAE